MKSFDPMEEIVRRGLVASGIEFVQEEDPRALRLDFYLPRWDIHIEVKQFHTDRIAEQMSRAQNVIAIQGIMAAKMFELMLDALKERSIA